MAFHSLSVDTDNENPSASLNRMCQGGGPAKAWRITGGEVSELLDRVVREGRLLVGEEREGLLVLDESAWFV